MAAAVGGGVGRDRRATPRAPFAAPYTPIATLSALEHLNIGHEQTHGGCDRSEFPLLHSRPYLIAADPKRPWLKLLHTDTPPLYGKIRQRFAALVKYAALIAAPELIRAAKLLREPIADISGGAVLEGVRVKEVTRQPPIYTRRQSH